ncbi:MAG: ABC transporter permease, partial [Candidatus Bathyarchaeia archaeon]
MAVRAGREFWKEYRKHKMGVAGLVLLVALIAASLGAVVAIPVDTFKQWHNPAYWTDYPKTAYPAWTNLLTGSNMPEHLILSEPVVAERMFQSVKVTSHLYPVDFQYNSPPEDFSFKYSATYGEVPPFIELSVTRPDSEKITIMKTTASPKPLGVPSYSFNGTVYSADRQVHAFVAQSLGIPPSLEGFTPQAAIFLQDSKLIGEPSAAVLKGPYVFNATFYTFTSEDSISRSQLVLGGKVFGLLGTDDLRRDLFIGIVWGTPIALFIGLSVATLAVLLGVIYGVVSGYAGRKTDEAMMRANDIIYALPALPFLIILTISLGRSILFVILYLILFGWVGIAKVARSISLQLKNLGYVEAAELTGASKSRIVFRHLIPQIMPYAFASIALSVPSAILTEAGLSFLGLGDPTLPTWGQILHDAQSFGASARGLWWWVIPPGAMIAITGVTFVLIGAALDAILNP